jgi:hypothetical protein
MTELRVRQSELTYEAALLPPVPALIDAPGKLASALVSRFHDLGVELQDLSLDDGFLGDKGLSFGYWVNFKFFALDIPLVWCSACWQFALAFGRLGVWIFRNRSRNCGPISYGTSLKRERA